jgi:hypothetical protein
LQHLEAEALEPYGIKGFLKIEQVEAIVVALVVLQHRQRLPEPDHIIQTRATGREATLDLHNLNLFPDAPADHSLEELADSKRPRNGPLVGDRVLQGWRSAFGDSRPKAQ